MFSRLRSAYGWALSPLARLLLRFGASPTGVTIAGTTGVVLASLILLPSGHLVAGALTIAAFLLGDGLDGTMARIGGRESRFGAFLDSTLDRLADAAVFAGLAGWGLTRSQPVAWLAIAALVAGSLVSYARARAEAEGWEASAGLFERTDRLVVALIATLAAGLGVGEAALIVGLAVVFVGASVTAAQRVAAALRASRHQREPWQPAP